jgi:hypothetical protein
MTGGTVGFVRTGLPSAASVGASIAASNAISKIPSEGNTIIKPTTVNTIGPLTKDRSIRPATAL